MTIELGNPDDPDYTVMLPTSFWQRIQTMLAAEKEIFPYDSEEYKRTMALIKSITKQTGIEPEWDKIL